jgi:hypothetical protein
MLKNFFKIFNKKSIIKIFIIIIVGFIIRITVNYAYNINVFIDYTNMISIFYYYFMALFAVVINEINYQFPISSFFGYVFSVVKKFPYINLGDLKLSFLRKIINKFIYGSNKMCLGSDNPVKGNCVKSNIDTPINLFHNGTSSKANKNFNIPKSYDDTSFYVRSKGFTQNPQFHKDGFSNKSIKNDGYLNNSVSKTNKNLSNHQRPVINNLTTNKEFYSSSLESNYTNDTNHATVSYTDINKSHLDVNLNGYRKDADLRLFEPRQISDVDINYRRGKIIQNVHQKASALEYTN